MSRALKIAWPQRMMQRFCEGGFILVLTLSLFILLSLWTYHASDPGWTKDHGATFLVMNAGGHVGAYLADGFYLLFGYFSYTIPLYGSYLAAMLLVSERAIQKKDRPMAWLRAFGLFCLILGGCGLLAEQLPMRLDDAIMYPGGLIGQWVAIGLSHAFNVQGSLLLLMSLLLVGMTWLTGLSWMLLAEKTGQMTWIFSRGLAKSSVWIKQRCALWMAQRRVSTPRVRSRAPAALKKEPVAPRVLPSIHALPEPAAPKTMAPITTLAAQVVPGPVTSSIKKTLFTGQLPSLSLLEKGQPGKPMGGYVHHELETLSRDVEQHLLDFGIAVNVVAVHPGPVITRFELQLAAGIKVSRLTALAKDLARSLSVTSVRVVEIIPGKTVVGIELPNPNRAMVCLSDVLSAPIYQEAHSALTLALGVDIAGHPMVVDLAKMPHLLVAGTTGSGKSVGINAMILSLLFKSTPQQVRLIMVDPKMLELSVYDGIPHLLTPVVTDMKEAASALRWCVAEMERRYRLMSALGVRNLAGYNSKILDHQERGEPITDPLWKPTDSMATQAPALETLPYIVVIIDELADMMMVVGKKVEQLIARIAQKARAAGIHLILATQRPSVDVLTGLIKSNIPTRISFQVSSKIDSRTILDQQGAEQLLGHGDMLFLAPGTGAPLRVHGAFVDDLEVHRIADDWRSRGEPQYIDEITQMNSESSETGAFDSEKEVEEQDLLYDQVVEFVVQTRKASISAVQRRFKIGYNRAARLIEEMERTGLVGPLDGGVRDVLVSSMTED